TKYMENRGNDWKYMENQGNDWKYMEGQGNDWKQVEASGISGNELGDTCRWWIPESSS
ncbi:hypothetical protein BDZ91DRAFT_746010, partial [Kalaharituber pfeilii]